MAQYVQDSTYSQDKIRKLFPILGQSTVYGTLPVINRHGALLSQLIGYATVNEEYIVQKIISDHQEKKKAEAAAWRLGVGLLTTFMGLGDGFQLGDALGGFAAGMIAGKVSDALQDLDGQQLKELGLEWVNDPRSYLYHRKRHRGDAVRRLLMLLPHPQTAVPCTYFGIQFADGYVAYLSLMPQQSDSASPANGLFCTNGSGFEADMLPKRQTLGMIICDSGQQLPVEFWSNGSSKSIVAIPYKAPHHSIY
ncbi:hypothetical protein NIES2100_34850 [Calothrix sp. NIES-2100]|uniref:hypothetical protein n=1 Tax=Calothrix sp. NIES-2100 TaxID=1954172 RepID=UPI000B5F7825|nr:hypothetical protein NIES2100_34850 [Calothrix sp. NIES-2100]